MTIYESHPSMYRFEHLGPFAAWVMQECLEAVCLRQLQLSRTHDLKMMVHLSRFSEAELMEITRQGNIELLQVLQGTAGDIRAFIRNSLKRWTTDALGVIGKLEIATEDITLISYMRATSYKEQLPRYTNDMKLALSVSEEMDRFFLGQTTSGFTTYEAILQEEIGRQRAQLLEAQAIARLGSYEWDILNDRSEETPELRRIFGLHQGQPFSEFMANVHPDDAPRVSALVEAALSTGRYDCEYRYRTPEGWKWLWARGVVIFEKEKPSLMRGTVQDITGIKHIEGELQRKTAALERSNENLQQFASVASHDLKEPLRKIAMFSSLITETEESLTPTSAHHLKRIRSSALRMQSMIEDILSFSALREADKKEVHLQLLLEEVLELLDQGIAESGASVTSDGLTTACVVPAQFTQIFQNLLSNALKFRRPDTPPQVGFTHEAFTEEGQPWLRLRVRDNGIGFEPEYAERIFGAFHRLHAKSDYEGTGLGLSICRRIAEGHGGRISASAQPGKGATFTIEIPNQVSSQKLVASG